MVALALCAHVGSAQTVTYETVIKSSDQIQGLPFGVYFTSIDRSPSINAKGDIAVVVDLGGLGVNFNNDSALLSAGSGTLTALAREGQQLPGAPVGKQFDRFWDPNISDSGLTVFTSGLRDSGIAISQYATHATGALPTDPLIELARSGTFAEEGSVQGSPYIFDILSFSPLVTPSGRVQFGGQISNGIDGIAGGAYLQTPGEPRIALRPHFPAPVVGYAPEVTIRGGGGFSLADTDEMLFVGEIIAPEIDDLRGLAFSGPAGTVFDGSYVLARSTLVGGVPVVELIACDNNTAPGTGTSFQLDPSTRYVRNNTGVVAFAVEHLLGGIKHDGIWIDEPAGSGPELLAFKGDSAFLSLPPVVFDGFDIGTGNRFGIGIGDDGTVIFEATLSGSSIVEGNDTGVFRVKQGQPPVLLGREGSAPPGGAIGTFYDSCYGAVVNGRGQVAMSWKLRGVFVTEADDTAVYASDTSGVMHPIIREGQQFDVSDDPMNPDVRTVDEAFFMGANAIGNAGHPTPFNDDGALALNVRFTDGTEAVVIAHIDPPQGSLCSADFDMDYDVDLGDFGVFGAAFNSVTGDGNYNPAADFDSDGDVDLGDFGVFGSQFGFGPAECMP